MKKIILSVFCAALFAGASAQQKVAEYRSDYNDKNFYVELGSIKEDGDYYYYVEVYADDSNLEDVNMRISKFTVPEFRAALLEAKSKYSEWVTVAGNNNVSFVEKKMNIDFPTVDAGFDYGDWEFTENEISPVFKVDGDKCLLVIKGSPIVNEVYTCKNYNITFSSEEEIDAFIKCFDETVADNHYGKSIKAQKLAPASLEETTDEEFSDFTTYHSDYFGKDFTVQLSARKDGEFIYRIETASGDSYMDTVKICIKSSELKNMTDAMTQACDYYKRWSDVAAKNNITDIDKVIGVQFPKCTGGFTYGDSWFSEENNDTSLTPRFRVMDGKYMLILTGSKIVTDYVDCDAFYIPFESQADIDSFMKCLDPALAEAHFANKSGQDDLFR